MVVYKMHYVCKPGKQTKLYTPDGRLNLSAINSIVIWGQVGHQNVPVDG